MTDIYQWNWQDKETTQSTNDDAVALSNTQTTGRFIISSKEQTRGRGRRGRSWIGLEGNLFFSQGLIFDISCIGQLIALSSLSLYESIKALLPSTHRVNLKWPNDLLIDNQKVSGMLLEKGHNGYIIIGIGVNIKQAPPSSQMLYPVTSLMAQGIDIDRLAFLRSYIANFDKNEQSWQTYGFEVIKQKWLEAVQGLNTQISVHTDREELIGIFKGIGDDGELLLETREGLRHIYAGDVFYM